MLSVKAIKNNSSNSTSSLVFIRERNFVVKNLATDSEKIQAYRLRHRVFCHELGWVPKTENEQEVDEYDHRAIFLGVFDKKGRLL